MCATCGCGKKTAPKKAAAKKSSKKALTPKQQKLDVAKPKGKLTGADFSKLRKGK
jgi:hypothetical protein